MSKVAEGEGVPEGWIPKVGPSFSTASLVPTGLGCAVSAYHSLSVPLTPCSCSYFLFWRENEVMKAYVTQGPPNGPGRSLERLLCLRCSVWPEQGKVWWSALEGVRDGVHLRVRDSGSPTSSQEGGMLP